MVRIIVVIAILTIAAITIYLIADAGNTIDRIIEEELGGDVIHDTKCIWVCLDKDCEYEIDADDPKANRFRELHMFQNPGHVVGRTIRPK